MERHDTAMAPAGSRPSGLGTLTVLDDPHDVKVVRGGFLGDVRIGDALTSFTNYRPVAVAVVLLILIGLALPAPSSDDARDGVGGIVAPAAQTVEGAGGAAAGAGETAAAPGVAQAPTEPVGFADQPVAFASVPASAFVGSTATSSSDGVAAAPPVSASVPAVSQPAVPATQALRVTSKAWASRTAGTPLAADGVPSKSLPIGARLGQIDKASYIRVTGSSTSVTLKVADASGQRSAEGALIDACQITTTEWSDAEAMSFTDAPAYDTTLCVKGARNADGSWTFDLTRFPERTDQRGFALVPGAGAPLDFQVALLPA